MEMVDPGKEGELRRTSALVLGRLATDFCPRSVWGGGGRGPFPGSDDRSRAKAKALPRAKKGRAGAEGTGKRVSSDRGRAKG